MVSTKQFLMDYQKIKVQKILKTLKPGTIPKALWGVLDNSLVDTLNPGDDVIVSGILRKR